MRPDSISRFVEEARRPAAEAGCRRPPTGSDSSRSTGCALTSGSLSRATRSDERQLAQGLVGREAHDRVERRAQPEHHADTARARPGQRTSKPRLDERSLTRSMIHRHCIRASGRAASVEMLIGRGPPPPSSQLLEQQVELADRSASSASTMTLKSLTACSTPWPCPWKRARRCPRQLAHPPPPTAGVASRPSRVAMVVAAPGREPDGAGLERLAEASCTHPRRCRRPWRR